MASCFTVDQGVNRRHQRVGLFGVELGKTLSDCASSLPVPMGIRKVVPFCRLMTGASSKASASKSFTRS